MAVDATTIDHAARAIIVDLWDVSADDVVLEAPASDGALSFSDALAAVEGSQAMESAASAVEPIEMFTVTVTEPRLATVSLCFDASGALVAASLFDDHDV